MEVGVSSITCVGRLEVEVKVGCTSGLILSVKCISAAIHCRWKIEFHSTAGRLLLSKITIILKPIFVELISGAKTIARWKLCLLLSKLKRRLLTTTRRCTHIKLIATTCVILRVCSHTEIVIG